MHSKFFKRKGEREIPLSPPFSCLALIPRGPARVVGRGYLLSAKVAGLEIGNGLWVCYCNGCGARLGSGGQTGPGVRRDYLKVVLE
jgi:hypothetical protein